MMKKIPNFIRETYEHGDCYIEICEGAECYEAYIQRKGYGVKHLMFGALKSADTYEGFVELVRRNADEYATKEDEEVN